jgi:hypothetical protein
LAQVSENAKVASLFVNEKKLDGTKQNGKSSNKKNKKAQNAFLSIGKRVCINSSFHFSFFQSKKKQSSQIPISKQNLSKQTLVLLINSKSGAICFVVDQFHQGFKLSASLTSPTQLFLLIFEFFFCLLRGIDLLSNQTSHFEVKVKSFIY